MLGFTQIGSGITALVIALVLFLTGNRLLSYELMLGTLTLWLVVELVKFLVHRSRPFIRLAQARIVGYRAIGRSFPSGHTSQAFFMATLFSYQFQLGVRGNHRFVRSRITGWFHTDVCWRSLSTRRHRRRRIGFRLGSSGDTSESLLARAAVLTMLCRGFQETVITNSGDMNGISKDRPNPPKPPGNLTGGRDAHFSDQLLEIVQTDTSTELKVAEKELHMNMSHTNDHNHLTLLQGIARRAMIERGLLPDFSPAALAELDRIHAPAIAANDESIRDLRELLWAVD